MRNDALPSESFNMNASQKKTDRRVVRTKRALFDAYERLMAKDAGGRITITALTAEANIDRKTFYLHFASIDEMLNEMCAELVAKIMAPYLEQRASLRHSSAGDAPEEAGRLFLQNVSSMFMEINDLLRDNAPVVQRMFENTTLDQLVARFREPLVKELKKDSTITDEALEHCCSFFIGGLLCTYSLWLQSGDYSNVEKVSELSNLILSDGLGGYLSSPLVVG